MSKLKSKPPAQPLNDIDAFVSGAEKPATIQSDPSSIAAYEVYPWQDPNIREDVLKIYNLRLPEPYLLKLKYIAQHTPESMQKFCLDHLLKAIDDKVNDLTHDA